MIAEKKTIYIAGPMRGYVHYNFPAFDHARDQLRIEGWDVISPADLDRHIDGFDPRSLPEDTDWTQVVGGLSKEACIKRDLRAIQMSDAIYMLRDWEASTGAKAELAVAQWLGLEVYYQ